MTMLSRFTSALKAVFRPRTRRRHYVPTTLRSRAASAPSTDLAARIPAAPTRPVEAPSSTAALPLPRRSRVFAAFDANMPVVNRGGLAGRAAELEHLRQSVLEQRMHAVICGARGSGKTSLARVFAEMADEEGFLVFYDIIGGNLSFDALCRGFLTDLVRERSGMPGHAELATLLEGAIDGRNLAIMLAQYIDRPVIVLIDEFDRITTPETKNEFAGLLKLVSDLRCDVRFVVAGIAADLHDLIAGHPSLRRHMAMVRTGGVEATYLQRLLEQCASRAGVEIESVAARLIVDTAMGSPYHLRFFGLCGSIAALDGGSRVVDLSMARVGLRNAAARWLELSSMPVDLTMQLDTLAPPLVAPLRLILATAAGQGQFDPDHIVSALAAPGRRRRRAPRRIGRRTDRPDAQPVDHRPVGLSRFAGTAIHADRDPASIGFPM